MTTTFRHASLLALAAVLLLLMTSCNTAPNDQREELLISAAVSLKDSLEEIQTIYEQREPDVKLRFNFGGSGTLRQQIEQGADADLFLSADESQMVLLVEKQLVHEAQQTAFAANELVAVVPAGSMDQPKTVQDLAEQNFKYIALGDPQTVPAGLYAKQAFEHLNVWDSLKEKTVFANNVRQVLTYVETGNADAGIVYKTDAMTTDKVDIAFNLDSSTHRPIRYVAGIVQHTANIEQAEAFFSFLLDEEAHEIFAKHGFSEAAS